MTDFIYGYQDIVKPYLDSTYEYKYPLFPYWQNNPLSTDSLIYPRRAGFNPYPQPMKISEKPKFIESDCPFFQAECDLILPVNKCYIKEPQKWVGNLIFNR